MIAFINFPSPAVLLQKNNASLFNIIHLQDKT